MRTPNTECVICGKPLYRRPKELAKIRYAACLEHRNEAQTRTGLTEAQQVSLMLGRRPGTNNRKGYKHREESKRKISVSHKVWCAANPDKIKARGAKTRGANHYNWKGGISKISCSIRLMTEYRKWANEVVRRDGKCRKCGSEIDLEAHHITPFADIIAAHNIATRQQARECKELWDLNNGIAMCEQCHAEHHGRRYSSSGKGRRKKPRKMRQSIVGSANPNYRGGRISLICPQCDNTFEVKKCEVNKRKYCSRRCLSESKRRNI